MPVADITIAHSNRKQSGMGILGASMDRILNAGLAADAPIEMAKGQDALVGLLQEWKMTPGHMMWDGQQKKEVPRECWEVVWVEGMDTPAASMPTANAATAQVKSANVVNSIDVAVGLLDGKTEQQWYSVIFSNPTVKGDTALTNSIIGKSFIPAMLTAGKMTKDANGVYHKSA
jgi:hypothetical protein